MLYLAFLQLSCKVILCQISYQPYACVVTLVDKYFNNDAGIIVNDNNKMKENTKTIE